MTEKRERERERERARESERERARERERERDGEVGGFRARISCSGIGSENFSISHVPRVEGCIASISDFLAPLRCRSWFANPKPGALIAPESKLELNTLIDPKLP